MLRYGLSSAAATSSSRSSYGTVVTRSIIARQRRNTTSSGGGGGGVGYVTLSSHHHLGLAQVPQTTTTKTEIHRTSRSMVAATHNVVPSSSNFSTVILVPNNRLRYSSFQLGLPPGNNNLSLYNYCLPTSNVRFQSNTSESSSPTAAVESSKESSVDAPISSSSSSSPSTPSSPQQDPKQQQQNPKGGGLKVLESFLQQQQKRQAEHRKKMVNNTKPTQQQQTQQQPKQQQQQQQRQQPQQQGNNNPRYQNRNRNNNNNNNQGHRHQQQHQQQRQRPIPDHNHNNNSGHVKDSNHQEGASSRARMPRLADLMKNLRRPKPQTPPTGSSSSSSSDQLQGSQQQHQQSQQWRHAPQRHPRYPQQQEQQQQRPPSSFQDGNMLQQVPTSSHMDNSLQPSPQSGEQQYPRRGGRPPPSRFAHHPRNNDGSHNSSSSGGGDGGGRYGGRFQNRRRPNFNRNDQDEGFLAGNSSIQPSSSSSSSSSSPPSSASSNYRTTTGSSRGDRDRRHGRGGRSRRGGKSGASFVPMIDLSRTITLPNHSLTLTEVSLLLRVKIQDIKRRLKGLGEIIPTDITTTVDGEESYTIDTDLLELLVLDYGFTSIERSATSTITQLQDEEALLLQRRGAQVGSTDSSSSSSSEVETNNETEKDDEENQSPGVSSSSSTLPPRPPVVCIMGHVDHGKTTLMDALRQRSIESGSGGKSSGPSKKQKKSKKGGTGGAAAKKGTSKNDNVAGTEAGGITQIISAFQVAMNDGSSSGDGDDDDIVTFLDTPGHAAFRSMRQSGSHAADVIVLVVAAEDGVSEQTVEIINFYKSIVRGSGGGADGSGISMVVALNKIDKPGVILDEAMMRVESQLLEHGILTEGMMASTSNLSDDDIANLYYGPPVQVIPTSGLTGEGLDDLMEGLLLQSEVMDLRADDKARAEGIVMDARMEKGLGVVADCVIRWGSLQRGDVVVSGTQIGRVKTLKDVNDKMLKIGLPSQPVRIVGFRSLPKAGDPVICVESEEMAEELVARREALGMSHDASRPDAPSASQADIQILGMRSRDSNRMQRLHSRHADILGGNGGGNVANGGADMLRIPVVIKADADGSLAAVTEALINMGKHSKENVIVDPVSKGIGAVTASDIQMAKEGNATIFVFGSNTRSLLDQATSNLAETEEVAVHSNNIIYSLLDEAKEVLGAYLPKVSVETVHGEAIVQAIFEIDGEDGKESIAGLRVTDGSLYKDKAPTSNDKKSTMLACHYRVFRDGVQICPKPTSADGDSNDNTSTIDASSLRKFKELVDNVRRGEECGLGLVGFHDFKEGDTIECYSIEFKAASL